MQREILLLICRLLIRDITKLISVTSNYLSVSFNFFSRSICLISMDVSIDQITIYAISYGRHEVCVKSTSDGN